MRKLDTIKFGVSGNNAFNGLYDYLECSRPADNDVNAREEDLNYTCVNAPNGFVHEINDLRGKDSPTATDDEKEAIAAIEGVMAFGGNIRSSRSDHPDMRFLFLAVAVNIPASDGGNDHEYCLFTVHVDGEGTHRKTTQYRVHAKDQNRCHADVSNMLDHYEENVIDAPVSILSGGQPPITASAFGTRTAFASDSSESVRRVAGALGSFRAYWMYDLTGEEPEDEPSAPPTPEPSVDASISGRDVTVSYSDGEEASVRLRIWSRKPSYQPSSLTLGDGVSFDKGVWRSNPRTMTFSREGWDDVSITWRVSGGNRLSASVN